MLTKRGVDGLSYDPSGPKRQMVYDVGGVPGFAVLVRPSGLKSFVLQYRPLGSGVPRLLTLGRYPTLTVDQARKVAQTRLYEARHGTDPVEAKRQAKREVQSRVTVRELCTRYLEHPTTAAKKSSREDARRIKRHLIPAWGTRRVEDVTRQDVARLCADIGKAAPYEANRTLALVSVLFNRAADWGLLDERAPNPAARVQKFPERSRERFVTDEEMPKLWAAIAAVPDPLHRAVMQLALLTGLRQNEVLRLRWDGIDLTRGTLAVADTKNARSHTLPLSAPARDVLNALPRRLGSPYVFPDAHNPDKPLRAPALRVAWDRVREQAELGDVRFHDLRRTAGSWLARSGASLALIGKVLNHSNPSTTAIYARFQDEAPRQALDDYAARLLDVVRGA